MLTKGSALLPKGRAKLELSVPIQESLGALEGATGYVPGG